MMYKSVGGLVGEKRNDSARLGDVQREQAKGAVRTDHTWFDARGAIPLSA